MKALQPVVEEVNLAFDKLQSLSDDELRAKTQAFQEQIQEAIKAEQAEADELRSKLEAEEEIELKERYYEQLDQIDEKIKDKIEDVLNEIKADAFAVVKETARRWKENGELVVSASDYDKVLANSLDAVKIEGDKAVWSKEWLAAGAEIKWDMMHYDVQLIGGSVLHDGNLRDL